MVRMETRSQHAELSRGKDGKWGVGTFRAKVSIRPRTVPLCPLVLLSKQVSSFIPANTRTRPTNVSHIMKYIRYSHNNVRNPKGTYSIQLPNHHISPPTRQTTASQSSTHSRDRLQHATFLFLSSELHRTDLVTDFQRTSSPRDNNHMSISPTSGGRWGQGNLGQRGPRAD